MYRVKSYNCTGKNVMRSKAYIAYLKKRENNIFIDIAKDNM